MNVSKYKHILVKDDCLVKTGGLLRMAGQRIGTYEAIASEMVITIEALKRREQTLKSYINTVARHLPGDTLGKIDDAVDDLEEAINALDYVRILMHNAGTTEAKAIDKELEELERLTYRAEDDFFATEDD